MKYFLPNKAMVEIKIRQGIAYIVGCSCASPLEVIESDNSTPLSRWTRIKMGSELSVEKRGPSFWKPSYAC